MTRSTRRCAKRTLGPCLTLLFALAGAQIAAACMPAPCIEADPNPVVLASGVNTGQTTVDWDAGPVANATVLVEIDGNQSVFANSAVGQGQADIEFGKAYTFTVADGFGTKLASVDVTASRKRPMAVADTDTKITPIITAAALPAIETLFAIHGTYIDINASVREPRNITVFVSRNQPTGCSADGLDIVTVGAQGTNNYRLQHSLSVYNLEPSNHYFWLLKMTDESGASVCRDGSFRTRSRVSTITVKDIFVFDDSDELSEGDLQFGFFVNPAENPGPGNLAEQVSLYPESGETSITSGTIANVEPDRVFPIPDAEEVFFNVTGVDDDDDTGPGQLSTCGGLLVPRTSAASTDCVDINGRTKFLYLGPENLGNEEISRNFTVRVVGGALEFEANCHLRVTYQ